MRGVKKCCTILWRIEPHAAQFCGGVGTAVAGRGQGGGIGGGGRLSPSLPGLVGARPWWPIFLCVCSPSLFENLMWRAGEREWSGVSRACSGCSEGALYRPEGRES